MWARPARLFNAFQSRFTYRQKFSLMALLFLSSLLIPTYWNLRISNFFIRHNSVQEEGMRFASPLRTLFYNTASYALTDSDPASNYQAAKQIEESLKQLNKESKTFRPITEENLLDNTSLRKAAIPVIDPLSRLWKQVREASDEDKNKAIITLMETAAQQLEMLGSLFDLKLPQDRLLFEIAYADLSIYPFLALQVTKHALNVQNAPDITSILKQLKKNNLEFEENPFTEGLNRLDSLSPLLAIDDLNTRSLKAEDKIHKLITSSSSFYHRMMAIVFITLLAGIAVVVFFLVFRVLTGHLLKLMTFIELISRGKFAIPLNINTNDAVGQIGVAFNRMGKSIAGVISQLQQVGSQLKDFSRKIAVMADDQEDTVVRQESNLKNLELVTSEIAVKTRDLANTMSSLGASSRALLLDPEKTLGIEEMESNMEHLTTASTRVLESLTSVDEKMTSASSLVSSMMRVSDQAHLLSLNAAIETLGLDKFRQLFADITEQIQRFAKTSAASTKQINNIVTTMTINVQQAKTTAKHCLKEVKTGVDRLLWLNAQLASITREGEKQQGKFAYVNSIMQEQAAAAEEIISTISGLSSAAQQNTASIRELRLTIEELAKTTHELHQVLHLFFADDTIEKVPP